MKLSNDRVYLFLTILSVLILGLINLPTPLFGDQAFFLLGAKEMDEGYVLYRDFWDVKQPGIFLFFLAGGKIFGLSEVGIHLFELFYWLLFTVVLVWFLKKYKIFINNSLNYLVPVMIIGIYSVAPIGSMTQVEALVNFPLLLVLIFNTLYLRSKRNSSLWLFFSGVAGGLVLYFKIIFAPIVIAFWIYPHIKELKVKPLVSIVYKTLLISSGVFIAWAPFLIYCYKHNILELCYDTFFNIPPLILKYGSNKPVEHLLNSAWTFFTKFTFIIPLTLASVILLKRKFLAFEMWNWLILGMVIILLQRTSWYSYHFQLLYTPLIFLALLTVDYIINEYKFKFKYLEINKLLWLPAFLIFINSIAIFYIGKKFLELSKYNFALTENDKINYAKTNKYNALAYRIAINLKTPGEVKCPIFVVNDPLVYYYTNRNQATSQSGWSMQLFIPGQINILCNELKKTKPCYIYINNSFNEFFESKGLIIMNWIKENYIVHNSNSDGIWYKFN